ncbi:hypothetical protein SAMN05216167_103255 [Spirosoma endophyticum]|uniref:Uncharacterized protein n=1 Tax=Spirosoma endophyticum TaxID=662367 RepID=A0A1I1PRY8_9BACT|nr:hypothetical protein SAMN05216167_103255 [Spirosoma endophyticum]
MSKTFGYFETFFKKQLLSLQSFFEGNISITKVSPPLTHGLMYLVGQDKFFYEQNAATRTAGI